MTIRDTNRDHAKGIARQLAASKDQGNNLLGGIWHWVNGVASGIGHFIAGPVDAAFKAVWAAIHEMVDAYGKFIDTLYRVIFYWELALLKQIRDYINRWLNRIYSRMRRDFRYLVALINQTAQYVLTIAVRRVNAERKARILAVRRAETIARREVRALHHVVEREAASGYQVDQTARLNLIVRILDIAVTRDPLLADLVSTITTGILDLLAVDDPPARLLLGFLIKHVIDRLGIDRAIGTLAQDLLAPILGEPKPRNIHDVVADLSKRLDAVERQWAKFFADGGAQVEQAGEDWRDITGVLGNAAILAFTIQGVADPAAWARELNDTIGTAANDLVTEAAALFRGA